MTQRLVTTLAAVVLLVSCVRVTTPTPSPTVAPTTPAPMTAAPTPTPAPVASPTPTATDPGRFGVLLRSAGRISVRSETSFGTSVYATGGERPAASHSGKLIAFWRTGPQGGNQQELRIATLPTGDERVLTTLPTGIAGGDIVWASDDTALLYESHSTTLLPGAGGGPALSALTGIELAGGGPITDPALSFTSGQVFVPLAWDKPGQLASALWTGEGGNAGEYVTWDRRTDVVKKTRFPWQVIAGSVNASHDAKRLLAIDAPANGVRVWPVADIGAAELVKAGPKVSDARWRNGVPSDISWVVGANVDVFTYQTSTVTTWYEGRGPRILAWRVDGSGVVLFDAGRGTFVMPEPRRNPLQLFDQDAGVVGTVVLR